MRRLFSYLSMALLCCLSASSCIFEKVENNTDKDLPTVNLKLSMPMTRGTDSGTPYERTIIGTSDVNIFLFDQATDRYIGQATNLRVKSGGNSSVTRVMEGDLPLSTLGKKVRLVFMANYGNRGAAPSAPSKGQDYAAWAKGMKFSYGNKRWSEADAQSSKYIPMSGVTNLTINLDPHWKHNNAYVELQRAVAKVRVQVIDGCKSKLTSLQVYNANPEGFSLIHLISGSGNGYPQVEVPNTYQYGLYDVLNQTGITTTTVEFYMPESTCIVDNAKNRTSMKITFDGKPEQTEIQFAEYKDSKPTKFYDIVRNTIYVFNVNKKADENKVDVQVSVMPWTTVDLGTIIE